MCSLCLVMILLLMSVTARFLPEDNEHPVVEIQNAVCHIAVSEINASANATMTRQLKGILTSSELEKQINALEKRILFEINKIAKTVLETQPQQKFFIARQDRAAEIAGLNMTAQREGSSALTFNYFWKIDNILSVISSSGAFAEESADFHFAGHHLRLSLFSAQESNSKYYEQQLFAKMIRMREEVNYALPHQLILVNQVDKNLDRASDILYCGTTDTFYSACASYQFSADILQSSEFIQDDDSLIIRLLIHLNYQ